MRVFLIGDLPEAGPSGGFFFVATLAAAVFLIAKHRFAEGSEGLALPNCLQGGFIGIAKGMLSLPRGLAARCNRAVLREVEVDPRQNAESFAFCNPR